MKMKCVAIGDMFVKQEVFDRVLKKEALFSSYQSRSWMAQSDWKKARSIIQNIEAFGAYAYALDEEVKEAMQAADVIFTHLCPIPKEVIEKATHLKYILTARGGLENIDVACAQKQGVSIIHCPIHNAFAVAEMTIGLMICETRNIARSHMALKQGIWRESYPNSTHIKELRSCTIGLLGFGTIGRLVAKRLVPFQARILVHDPFADGEEIKRLGYEPVTLTTLLATSDLISLHCRIPHGAPALIGKKELELMKKDAVLINTARATLIDMDALSQALAQKQIGGAAIDVFSKEPLDPQDAILKEDRYTLSNHRCGDTLDSYEQTPALLLTMLHEMLTSGHTKYLVRETI